MSTRAQRQAELMSLYDTLPGGQTQKERSLYGFIPESGYQTGLSKVIIKV